MRSVILSAFQLIGAILSAFGGALLKAEPPNIGRTNAAAYIAAFSAVVLLLAITSITKHFGKRIRPLYYAILSLLFLGFFILGANIYEHHKRELTIGLPPNEPKEWYIIGTEKTPYGEAVFQNAKNLPNSIADPAAVVWGVSGGVPERIRRIWTLNSIEQSVQRLTLAYIMVIVFLSSAIFFGAEGAKRPDNAQEATSSEVQQEMRVNDDMQISVPASSVGEPKKETRQITLPQSTTPIEVFFSYAHEDESLKDKLVKQLSILQSLGVITTWHDDMIIAGTNWNKEIERHLNSSQIILLLVSADFLASSFCYGTEMVQALNRHESGEARTIPIILRACRWTKAPFGKLQALPKGGKPVASWSNIDEAFENIAEGIEKAIEDIRGQERHSLHPPPSS